ncbi:hypothetical protein SUNI508_10637 [Seiridium unicorne]|uniref:Uncharacterized protein n=1 Tax=Seiridium unicorne TaxID=138068 RepID=A0ABR2UKG6_9PEZI
MTRVSALFVLSLLAATAFAGQDWFSGIVKALRGANQLTRFFDALPDSVREPIENTEVGAAAFVCSIMRGQGSEMTAAFAIPEASAIEQEFSTITSFVGAIPSIAADTLSYIVNEGEDAVSVVGVLLANPSAAVSLIEGGVETIISDVECFLFSCTTSHGLQWFSQDVNTNS